MSESLFKLIKLQAATIKICFYEEVTWEQKDKVEGEAHHTVTVRGTKA
nr:hypothetical protein [Providencia rettgeri]